MVGGCIGLSGPGELLGTDGGLTVNLLGLNYILSLNKLLSIGQYVQVFIENVNVNGIGDGFTVEATGQREENFVLDYTASGFVARSNSTKVENAHVTNLKSVNGSHVITIEILNMKTDGTAKYTAGADIKVTYSATLNKDAVVGTTPSNTNSAKVEYQNGPEQNDHGFSNPSITTTRTYPVKVQKHDYDVNEQNTFLAGAKFALSTSATVPTFTKNEAGDSYTLDNAETNTDVVRLVETDKANATYRVAEKNDEAGAVTYFTTVDTMATTINGLKAGTYYFHEIEAPKGYNKLTAPVKVTITETTGDDGKVNGVTYTVNDQTPSNDSNVKIDNKTGSMLPSTGGMGTIGLTALGVGVVAFGVLAPRKKKERQ